MPLASHGSVAESEKRIRDMRRASSSGLGDEKPWVKAQASKEKAEIAALQDTPRFIERAQALYAYDNFVCDSGGSICEVVNPEDADDPVLKTLVENLLMVWIEDTPDHMEELARRFDRAAIAHGGQRIMLHRLGHAEEDQADAHARAEQHREP